MPVFNIMDMAAAGMPIGLIQKQDVRRHFGFALRPGF